MVGTGRMVVLLSLTASTLAAQAPRSLSLSLRDAVLRARNTTPTAELARLRVEAARARVGVMRASLLPSLSGSFGVSNQTLNTRTFGIDFPTAPGQAALPDLAGPFGVVDA